MALGNDRHSVLIHLSFPAHVKVVPQES
jgi:hypothetical protein